MSACIVGWAHSKFGKHEGRDIEFLIVEVTEAALADAGVGAADIDTIYLGTMNGGFVRQEFPASLVFQADPGFRFKPATRVENACATGSAAIHQGLNAIAAGRARLALVVGVEKMTEISGAKVGDILLGASYRKEEDAIEGGFAGIFGQIAQSYFQRYGDQSDALARIAAKNHKNGAANPLAQMQKDLGYEFCRTVSDKNPIVAAPLKRTDCSLVSDGAAAVVLADTATALSMKKAVIFRAAEQVNDFLPMSRRDVIAFEGPALAWQQALAKARVSLDDLDLIETHDCFTIAELIEYEAMGLTPKGEGARAILEGWTEKDGRLPVNPSGGLKSKGHPIGATGVSMHVLAAMQATGQAGGIQVPGATLAGVMNMGGAAVANFVSILEPAVRGCYKIGHRRAAHVETPAVRAFVICIAPAWPVTCIAAITCIDTPVAPTGCPSPSAHPTHSPAAGLLCRSRRPESPARPGPSASSRWLRIRSLGNREAVVRFNQSRSSSVTCLRQGLLPSVSRPLERDRIAPREWQKVVTCTVARKSTAFSCSARVAMSGNNTIAAAPSEIIEQSVRFSGPATNGFFSDGVRQKS